MIESILSLSLTKLLMVMLLFVLTAAAFVVLVAIVVTIKKFIFDIGKNE